METRSPTGIEDGMSITFVCSCGQLVITSIYLHALACSDYIAQFGHPLTPQIRADVMAISGWDSLNAVRRDVAGEVLVRRAVGFPDPSVTDLAELAYRAALQWGNRPSPVSSEA